MKSLTVFFMLLLAFLSSCSKSDIDTNTPPTANSRLVKYVLSGTYSAPLQVTYINEDGITQSINGVTLPWSKEVTTNAGVTVVGLSSSNQTVDATMAGKTLMGKIFVGGVEKQSAQVFANSSGTIILSSIVQAL
jgi:hypothetical protein